MDKLYIVKSCGNEYDDLGYDPPYPIYYSLNKDNARSYFEKLRDEDKKHLNDFLEKYPQYKDNEDYQITEDTENRFEYGMGKWFYVLEFEEVILENDLRYENKSIKSNS